MDAISLNKLSEILDRETSVLSPEDVGALMDVIRDEADANPAAKIPGERVAGAAVIARARKLYERDGEVEIDDTARESRASGETGCYVSAWVWVPDAEEGEG